LSIILPLAIATLNDGQENENPQVAFHNSNAPCVGAMAEASYSSVSRSGSAIYARALRTLQFLHDLSSHQIGHHSPTRDSMWAAC
jgi:hypothetical protein